MTKIKTFVYTDLNTKETFRKDFSTKETFRKDFSTKKQIDKFFDPEYMYPLVILDKVVYDTGSYRVIKENYCI